MAVPKKKSVEQLQAEVERLRKKVRELQKTRKDLQNERDEYFQVIYNRFKEESDWSDFNAADFVFTLEDVFAEFEKEHGICLSKNTKSPTLGRSRKNSKQSSSRPNN